MFNVGVNDQVSIKDEAAARTQEIFSHTFREADPDQESPVFARITKDGEDIARITGTVSADQNLNDKQRRPTISELVDPDIEKQLAAEKLA